MLKYRAVAEYSAEDGGYIVTYPAFPGLSAFGETMREAAIEAKVALGLFIESYKEHGIALPEEDGYEGADASYD